MSLNILPSHPPTHTHMLVSAQVCAMCVCVCVCVCLQRERERRERLGPEKMQPLLFLYCQRSLAHHARQQLLFLFCLFKINFILFAPVSSAVPSTQRTTTTAVQAMIHNAHRHTQTHADTRRHTHRHIDTCTIAMRSLEMPLLVAEDMALGLQHHYQT